MVSTRPSEDLEIEGDALHRVLNARIHWGASADARSGSTPLPPLAEALKSTPTPHGKGPPPLRVYVQQLEVSTTISLEQE